MKISFHNNNQLQFLKWVHLISWKIHWKPGILPRNIGASFRFPNLFSIPFHLFYPITSHIIPHHPIKNGLFQIHIHVSPSSEMSSGLEAPRQQGALRPQQGVLTARSVVVGNKVFV